MKKLFSLIAIAATFAAFPAFALDLQEARASGAVGEKIDGYITAISSSPEVSKLVSEVNSKRKAEYARISKENGQPVDIVAKLAASQLIGSLPGGAMYQDPSGKWIKK